MDRGGGVAKKPVTVIVEVMRIDEVETADSKIKRTWTYEKKNLLKTEKKVVKQPVESEVNLMKANSYISKNTSPLAHRMKQKRIDQRERLHLN